MRDVIIEAYLTGDKTRYIEYLESVGLEEEELNNVADKLNDLENERKNTPVGSKYDMLTEEIGNYMENSIAPYLNEHVIVERKTMKL